MLAALFFGPQTSVVRYLTLNLFFFKKTESNPTANTDAAQAVDRTQRLQQLARSSRHPEPLLIGIEQEGGLVRDFFLCCGSLLHCTASDAHIMTGRK